MAEKDYDKLRATAEALFLSGSSLTEIAELLQVSAQTLSKWRKGRPGEQSWDDKKTELSLTPTRVRSILLKEAERIANGEKSTIDADAIAKILSAADRLVKKISVQVVYDVLKELDNYTAELNPRFANEATEFHKLFLQHKIQQEIGG